jgi:hypothetical protein
MLRPAKLEARLRELFRAVRREPVPKDLLAIVDQLDKAAEKR